VIVFEPASALVAALRRRAVSSVELLDLYLDRIARRGSAVNAVVTLDADRASAAAAAADRAAARGEWRGALHGLPVTVKDSIETAGLRTTCGVPALAGHVPARDAPAVARLKAAGAVVFGKTNTPPYAGDAQTMNELFGTTSNPWDVTRSPGGSSGGPAAAVAAGLTGLDLGSDLGGSIRMPAGYCGVYGLRPSYGLVPTVGHIPPEPGARTDLDMGVLGPLARGVDDLDLALDVLAGPDEVRAVAWRLALPPARSPTVRLGVWLDDPYCPVDAEVGDVLAGLVAALRHDGVKITDVAGPGGVREGARLFQTLAQPMMAAGLPDERFAELCDLAAAGGAGPSVEWAGNVTQRARDWVRAHARRVELGYRWADLFRDVDAVLCPVTPTTAIPHDHNPDEDARCLTVNGRPAPYWHQVRWSQAISAVYLPAAVVPAGLSRSGLPVGAQIVGPYLEDRTVVEVARRVARVGGGYRRPPGW
jgi:amidase